MGGGILPEAALRKVVLLSVAVALCQLGYWFKISVWLLRKIRFHHQNRYSNTEDFPTGLAWKAIVSLLVLMLSMWAVFLTDDRYRDFDTAFRTTLSDSRKDRTIDVMSNYANQPG